jgi:hypothetical protein
VQEAADSEISVEASKLGTLPSEDRGLQGNRKKERHTASKDFLDAELVTLFDAAEKYMEAEYRDNVTKNS